MALLHFEVVGYLWSGARAAYQYTDKTDEKHMSRVEARALRERIISGQARAVERPSMGDFEAIEDCRIVHEVNAYESTGRGISRRVDTFTTLAGWKQSASSRFYARMTYAR